MKEIDELRSKAKVLGLELCNNSEEVLQDLVKEDNNIKSEYWQGIRDAILILNIIEKKAGNV